METSLVDFQLYIVLFLHQTTTSFGQFISGTCCISYYSYIKPQLHYALPESQRCCISYYSYIKPQLDILKDASGYVVYRTIPTSNHNSYRGWETPQQVVYRTIPTSNHNFLVCLTTLLYVVYRTIPTSNHNLWRFLAFSSALYIVLFLHQTTTMSDSSFVIPRLYIVLFLHQTTTSFPQWFVGTKLYIVLFLHQTTTIMVTASFLKLLYIVLFLHQTTTYW